MTVLEILGTTYTVLSIGFLNFKNVTAIANTKKRISDKKIFYEPFVSINVPCYNENKEDLTKCVISCLQNDYKNKEVIVANDGSTNDTMKWLIEIKKKYPQLRVIDLKKNVGKKEAMNAAIKVSKGEIIVCVDSDTVIKDGEAIREIVQPFKDEKVMAVSGNTKVANETKNLLTKMQAGRYALAFEIEKAGQAAYSGVTCCPGCFSAYRATAVRDVLEQWLNHSVFGVKTSYGDDRSLTRMVLVNGGKVVYAGEAIAYTNVPETMPQLVKQQIRWKRSFASEHFFLLKSWNKLSRMIRFELSLFLTVFILGFFTRAYIILQTIMGKIPLWQALALYGIFSIVHYAYVLVRYHNMKGIYGAMYGLGNDLTLEWLSPYAWWTLRKTSWGTR